MSCSNKEKKEKKSKKKESKRWEEQNSLHIHM